MDASPSVMVTAAVRPDISLFSMTETFIISPFTLTVHQSLLEVAVISLIALTFIVPVPPADSNVTFELTICKEDVSLSSSLLHEKTNTHNNNANMLVIFFIICYLLINQLLSMLHLGRL